MTKPERVPSIAGEATNRELSASARRLQSGFSQILSFLILVEEGDAEQVARCRGLGRSTVGGHLRQVAEDYGNALFRRLETGLVPTPAGLAAYRTLRPLMVEIAGAFGALGAPGGGDGHGRRILLTMQDGLPGCSLARAAERAGLLLPHLAGRIDILPHQPGVFDGGSDILLTSLPPRRQAGVGDLGNTIDDRWAVAGLAGALGWAADAMCWRDLGGRLVALPALPDRLAAYARRCLAAAGARLGPCPVDVLDALPAGGALPGGGLGPGTLVLLPASLLNRALVGRHLRCALLEPGADDPVIEVARGRDSILSESDLAEFRQRVATALAGGEAELPILPELGGLTVRHCLSFCALHEERNIRRASERLCIVQPALTVQLRRIEDRLGMVLFKRSSRGIRPNHAADRLYALLHPPLTQLLHSSQSLSRTSRGGPAPKLRVGLMPLVDEDSTSAVSVARALDRCARVMPGQRMEVTEAFSARLVRWLRDGRVDLVVIDQPFDDPDLAFETIATDRLAVIVDSASDLLPPGPVGLEQLRTLPLVLPSLGNGLRRLLVEHGRRLGWTLQPQIEIDSIATILSLLKTTRYATVLPVGAVHLSRDRRQISVHEIHSPRLLRAICVGRRRREPHGEAAIALIEALREAFAALEPDQDRIMAGRSEALLLQPA